jgi:hypothetical protein
MIATNLYFFLFIFCARKILEENLALLGVCAGWCQHSLMRDLARATAHKTQPQCGQGCSPDYLQGLQALEGCLA